MIPDPASERPGAAGRGAPVSVVLVEDDPAHRERFREHLALDERLRLVGEFANAGSAIGAMPPLRPDVALVDIGLPDKSGFEVIEHIHRVAPATDILVVSVFGGERNLLRAIEAGATGYLLKDAMPPDFIGAIHALRAGESPISPSLARHLLRRFQSVPAPGADAEVDALTGRELDIIERIAQGASIAEIGARLFISPHTVKTHVKNIYRKLEAHTRLQAVRIAQERRLIGGAR